MPAGDKGEMNPLFSGTYEKVRSARNQTLSYNLTRAYPFSEATSWVVITCFILLLIPITFFNIATNGWNLQVAYTSDPNGTEAERHWFQSKVFIWGDDSLNPRCQRVDLRSGDQFMTTNYGISYTVTYINYQQHGQGVFQQYPSLSYKNNTLEDCAVDQIKITMAKDGQGDAVPIAPNATVPWWSWVPIIDAFAHCNVTGEDGLYQLGFTYRYQSAHGDYSYVAVNNATSQASIWWGTRILDSYVIGMRYLMAALSPGDDYPPYTNSDMVFLPSNGTSLRVGGDFEMQGYYMINAEGAIINAEPAQPFNNVNWTLSSPVTEALFVAKAFSSLILTDVGNNGTANLFLDPTSLQYALNPGNDDYNRVANGPLNLTTTPPDYQFDQFRFNGISPPTDPILTADTSVPLHEAYANFSSQTGPLGTKPATVQANYICSVPTRKSIPAIIFFVLTGDYVLMHGLWAIFKFFANMYAEKSVLHPTYCDGCLAQAVGQDQGDGIELKPQSSFSRSSRQSLMEPYDAMDTAYDPLSHS